MTANFEEKEAWAEAKAKLFDQLKERRMSYPVVCTHPCRDATICDVCRQLMREHEDEALLRAAQQDLASQVNCTAQLESNITFLNERVAQQTLTIEHLEAEVKRLAEFEWIYKDLCK